jgi:hypothetical protein
VTADAIGTHVIAGSIDGASISMEDSRCLPSNASVCVDSFKNLRYAFYTDRSLPVLAGGMQISETQPLEDITKRVASRFIDTDDEWFLSLQRVRFS